MEFEKVKQELCKRSGLEKHEVHTFLLDYFECTDTYQYPQMISMEEYEDIQEKIDQVAKGKPKAYVLEKTFFWDSYFIVSSDVLIPRFDTEILVECALPYANQCKILDMCTGSGIIGLTLAKHGKNVNTMISDISLSALKIAEQNKIKILNQEQQQKTVLVQSDLFRNINENFDIIVSNPPYIPTSDLEELDESVKNYEPMLALDGKEDGLWFYRQIITKAPEYLNENGRIFLEVGINQAKDIAKYLEKDFKYITIVKDNHGVERVVHAVKR